MLSAYFVSKPINLGLGVVALSPNLITWFRSVAFVSKSHHLVWEWWLCLQISSPGLGVVVLSPNLITWTRSGGFVSKSHHLV